MEERDLNQYDELYLPGHYNRAIRYYFYLEQGLNILNEFRNLFLGIFAAYIALKLSNPLWLVAMFAGGLPGLLVVGYYSVHKVAKIKEWLNLRFGTHYGIQSFNYNKRQVELLEELLKELRAKN